MTFFTLVTTTAIQAKDLGSRREIFEIIEEDAVKQVRAKLSALESSGRLAKMQDKWQKQSIKSANRPKGTDLPRAKYTKEFTYDPTIELQENIYDHKGQIIAFKGTRINPLNHIKIGR